MDAPTPCVCGEIVELHDMKPIHGNLPDGGNLVCRDCWCQDCQGDGECDTCFGDGTRQYCGGLCPICKGSGVCTNCDGLGYVKGGAE